MVTAGHGPMAQCARSEDDGEEAAGTAAEGLHAVRVVRIEEEAVPRVEHDFIVVDRYAQRAFEDEVELLARVAVGLEGASGGVRVSQPASVGMVLLGGLILVVIGTVATMKLLNE